MITLKQFLPYYMIAAAVLLIANVIWAYRDARERGRSGILVGLLVLLIPFPLGVIVWLIFRPRMAFAITPEERSEDIDAPIKDELADPDADIKGRANDGVL